ncbi:PEPxxWA-CTERM sorting domain-containing protein [Phenylobacterium sp.]|uniref:PEPxxWA-CTERM sorting domain-containing protein n=1 Tax=Phenylobacterium sp. TaxID=1871053 RepID=UPI00286DC044|nr:PEPxxWA-CTERM sorting domain-containing protein [Phenylobacterium sp.]
MFEPKRALAASLAALALVAGVPASAAIYDIAATDGLGTALTLAAGSYRIEFIGIADGGAYDSANVLCPTGSCSTGWTNSFSLRDSDFAGAFLPGGSTTVDVFRVGSLTGSYASALASLAAYKAGPVDHYGVDINSGVISPPVFFTTYPTSPFRVTLDADIASRLVVTDLDNTRTNNQGGVSLRITAVPEPGTWALMIGGFGLAGLALRRRRLPATRRSANGAGQL